MEVFNLNIRPGKACPVLHCSQFDKGRMFRANLFDGAEVFTLTGSETLSVIEKKTDGNMVTIGVANTSDSYVVFGTTEQMTALAGCQLCELRIVDGEDLIGSLNFLLDCEESPDTGIESESAIHNLQEQIGEAIAEQYAAEDVVFDAAPVAGHGTGFAVTSEGVKTYVEGEIAALTIPEELDDLSDVTITTPSDDDILVYQNGEWVNMANPASTANFGADYDENTTYNTGDKCVYNNLLYECNDDGVTGAWDATKWDSLTVASMTDNNLPHYTGTPTAGSTAEAIGDLSQLTTTDKSSLVGAVNEVNAKGYNDLGGRPIRNYMVSSSNPITIQGQIVAGYATFIIIGFVASLGGVVLAVQMSNGNLSKVIDLLTGNPFSSSHLTFSGSNSQLTIASDVNSNSNIMIWG